VIQDDKIVDQLEIDIDDTRDPPFGQGTVGDRPAPNHRGDEDLAKS